VAVLLSLLSSCLWGSADFGGGLLSRRIPALAVVGGSQAAALVAVTAVALGTGGFAGPAGWLPWAVLAGVSGAVGLICFYVALSSGKMGVVSPIAALGVLVPVFVGILSGEHPASLALIGMAVAIAGAVAASGPELRGGAGARPVVLAVVAGVGFGADLIFIAHGSRTSALMTLWGMRTTSVLAFALAAIVLRSVGGLQPTDLVPLALVGLADVSANLLYALASQRGLVSITAVLGSLYPVVTVLLARWLLKESLLRVQIVGVAATLIGVALVSAA
jgi:drug/metabolite transporter (DMT)-like permease